MSVLRDLLDLALSANSHEIRRTHMWPCDRRKGSNAWLMVWWGREEVKPDGLLKSKIRNLITWGRFNLNFPNKQLTVGKHPRSLARNELDEELEEGFRVNG